MNLLTSKHIEQYIENDKNYLITFVRGGNIFKNNIEQIHSISDDMVKYIINKLNILNKYEIYKQTNNFIRDMYFSQVRDKNDKFEKIYSNEYNFIKDFELFYKTYLIQLEYKTYDRQTFPNLNKYHYSSKVEQKIIKIENINLIIENNNIFIEFKNANINTLCDIINIINSFCN